MTPPKSLLVPVIGSGFPGDALSYAFWIASVSDAKVTVLQLGASGEGDATLHKQLAELHAQSPKIQFNEVQLPEQSDLGVALVRYANAHAVDLIVQSCFRPLGLAHNMTATISEKVLRFAECPVLCVRQAVKIAAP